MADPEIASRLERLLYLYTTDSITLTDRQQEEPLEIRNLPDASPEVTHCVRDERDIAQDSKRNTIRVSAQLLQKVEQLALSPLSFLDPKSSGFHEAESIEKTALSARRLGLMKSSTTPMTHHLNEGTYTGLEKARLITVSERNLALGHCFTTDSRLQRPFAANAFDEYMSNLASNGLEDFSKSLEEPAKVIAETIENWYKLRGLINTKESTAATERALEATSHRSQTEKLLGSSPTATTPRAVHQMQHIDSIPFQARALNNGMTYAQQQPPYGQTFLSAWPRYDASFITNTSFHPSQEGVEHANHHPLETGSFRVCESKEGSNGGKMSIQSMISTQRPQKSRLESTFPSIPPSQQEGSCTNSPWQYNVPLEDIELLVNLSRATRPMAVQNSL
ncbi:uncharacterized protein BKA55DRAFT_668642 [Fusarium redolens]|uniref:Uncharacterized protein n=1 Tax=Fusarium redolens TaxID=48865 RepID=A0A9P9FUY7_FUSRE|nr:uncharacterized protein BKA55DRAFT_668642 [Fusarium redolens]KAH7208446.1 hypothetical protein BKA55DRAFT_668642 [Fusarium redolens]